LGGGSMNKSLLAGAAFVGLTASSVFAADMPLKAPVKMAAYDWSGFYAGLNIGGSFGHVGTDWSFAGLAAGSTSHRIDGVVGGIQEGYNWQFGRFVVGMETDIQVTSQKGSASLSIAGAPPFTDSDTEKLPWFGTIRGRFGVTPVDRWLVYFTAGAAYGEIATDVTSVNTLAAPITVTANSNTVHTGWTVGGGVETALPGNWTGRLEYLHVDLGVTGGSCIIVTSGASSAACFTAPGSSLPFSTRITLTDEIVRFGFNYRFGADTVVAKY
jgi:outer membrane immunogenic protein